MQLESAQILLDLVVAGRGGDLGLEVARQPRATGASSVWLKPGCQFPNEDGTHVLFFAKTILSRGELEIGSGPRKSSIWALSARSFSNRGLCGTALAAAADVDAIGDGDAVVARVRMLLETARRWAQLKAAVSESDARVIADGHTGTRAAILRSVRPGCVQTNDPNPILTCEWPTRNGLPFDVAPLCHLTVATFRAELHSDHLYNSDEVDEPNSSREWRAGKRFPPSDTTENCVLIRAVPPATARRVHRVDEPATRIHPLTPPGRSWSMTLNLTASLPTARKNPQSGGRFSSVRAPAVSSSVPSSG